MATTGDRYAQMAYFCRFFRLDRLVLIVPSFPAYSLFVWKNFKAGLLAVAGALACCRIKIVAWYCSVDGNITSDSFRKIDFDLDA